MLNIDDLNMKIMTAIAAVDNDMFPRTCREIDYCLDILHGDTWENSLTRAIKLFKSSNH